MNPYEKLVRFLADAPEDEAINDYCESLGVEMYISHDYNIDYTLTYELMAKAVIEQRQRKET